MSKTSAPAQSENKQTPEQQLQQLRMQHSATCEILWESLRTLAPDTHKVTIIPRASNPLWELVFAREPGPDGKPSADGKMVIYASTMAEMTEQQKKKLVRFLKGSMRSIEEAIEEIGTPFPAMYVEVKVKDRIRFDPEVGWVPVVAEQIDADKQNLS